MKASSAVGHIGGNPLGLEIEPILDPLDHDLGGIHLFRNACRRRFNIDIHRLLRIDEIVEAVTEHNLVTPGDVHAAEGSVGESALGSRLGLVGLLSIERGQIFPNGTARPFLVAPIYLAALDPLNATGIDLNHAGIDREALAPDQA
jgi:hypothetical protein